MHNYIIPSHHITFIITVSSWCFCIALTLLSYLFYETIKSVRKEKPELTDKDVHLWTIIYGCFNLISWGLLVVAILSNTLLLVYWIV